MLYLAIQTYFYDTNFFKELNLFVFLGTGAVLVGPLSLHHPVPGQVDQLVQVLFGVDEPLGRDRLQDLDVDVALPEFPLLVVQEVILRQDDR